MKKLKIEIKSFGGSVLFSYTSEGNTIKKTLEEAVNERAYLSGADLRGADLRGAYLRGADLSSAYLRGADLSGADLRGADLRGAYLRGADLSSAYLRGAYLRGAYLRGADLSGADLRGADLRGADLRGADLSGADLRGAYLSGAYLSGADLRGADLSGIPLENLPQSYINLASRDMLFVFEKLKGELPFLRKKLIEGKVDGTQYEGDCACLIGTLANADGSIEEVCEMIPYYDKGVHNPGEEWFLHINVGDTPKNNVFAAHVLKLIDSVLKKKTVRKKVTNSTK